MPTRNNVPASINGLDLQCLLLERAERLLQYVAKKIPAKFRSTIAAEDVLQEVWLTAFRSFPDFNSKEPGVFDHWLTAIVNHRLADAIRAAGALKRGLAQSSSAGAAAKPTSWDGLLSRLMGREKTPSREMSIHEAVNALQIALAGLPEPRRQAVRMRLIEGRCREEIARTLQRSEDAVDALVRGGLRDLRRCLRHAGRFFTDAKSSADCDLRRG